MTEVLRFAFYRIQNYFSLIRMRSLHPAEKKNHTNKCLIVYSRLLSSIDLLSERRSWAQSS